MEHDHLLVVESRDRQCAPPDGLRAVQLSRESGAAGALMCTQLVFVK